MSYDRRKAYIDWLNKNENDQNSFAAASKRFASRTVNENKELQMTASRVMEIRKAAEEKKAKEIFSEDETKNSVARTKADFGPCKVHIGNEVNGGDPSVSLALKKIVAHLDRIASYCQDNGEIQLAKNIDMISNTIEAENK